MSSSSGYAQCSSLRVRKTASDDNNNVNNSSNNFNNNKNSFDINYNNSRSDYDAECYDINNKSRRKLQKDESTESRKSSSSSHTSSSELMHGMLSSVWQMTFVLTFVIGVLLGNFGTLDAAPHSSFEQSAMSSIVGNLAEGGPIPSGHASYGFLGH